MEKTKRISEHWPKVLPRIQAGADSYFVDLRLRQFRRAEGPLEFIDFGSETGRTLCDQANIVCCPACGASIIVSGACRRQELACTLCLGPIEPQ
jgi:hypothetical protein